MPYPCTKSEDVIVTTTPTIEGFKIVEYKSLVMSNKCTDKEEPVSEYRRERFPFSKYIENELKQEAFKIGANAVVGVSFVSVSETNYYFRGYGTAVICKSHEQIAQEEELKRQEDYVLKVKKAKEEFEKQETSRRLSEAKQKAEETGKFVYGAFEEIYPTFGTAKDLLLFLESLNITDESFINGVLPQIKEIQASESFRSSKLSSALELLKQLTE